MATVKKQVTIKGVSPLLMHRYSNTKIEAMEKKDPKEQAELVAYRDEKTKQLFLPADAVQRAMIGGATFSKGTGRATLQKPVAACLFVHPQHILLGISKYEIDARGVVIPATKGRITRYRPRLDSWQASFTIEYDDTLVTETQVKRVLDDTGTRVGLLDFRPSRKGPFGRFIVTEWKDIN